MAVLNSKDLFAVYQSEVGIVTGIGTENVNYSILDNSTGEAYNQLVTESNLVLVDEDEVNSTSIGSGLKLSYKVTAGEVKDIAIYQAGINYVQNEIVRISGTNVKVLVKSVHELGAVTSVELYDSGSGVVITNGLLTGYPYCTPQAHESLNGYYGETGDFINFLVDNSSVVGATTKTRFAADYNLSPNFYTVGEQIYVLGTRDADGPLISSDVKSVTGATSGGISKYSVDQLKTDVQEWASELDSDINMSVNVVDNDGTYDHGGDVTFDNDTRVLTYYRPYNPDVSFSDNDITIETDYGYNIQSDGAFSNTMVENQSQFNTKIDQRVQFIENNIYNNIQSDRINKDQPRLIGGTEARDASGTTYSEVATRHDIAIVEQDSSRGVTTANLVLDAIGAAATFEELKNILFPPDVADEP